MNYLSQSRQRYWTRLIILQIPPFSTLYPTLRCSVQIWLAFPSKGSIFLGAVALTMDDIRHVCTNIWQEST